MINIFSLRETVVLVALLLLSWSCTTHSEEVVNKSVVTSPRQITIQVNPAQTYQRIDNFGASDAWACQFVGNWPDQKKNAIADLLFSTDTREDGSPKGIGLSLWRFNIGAGSAQQGSNSGIEDEWRRAESFLQPNGNYDWQRQAGQQWFLQAAKQRGVSKFLAFTNSPPVWITKNGRAFSSDGMSNLAPEQYGAFSTYIVKVLQGLKEKGIDISYISPVNEPQWDWRDGGQEGTPYTNEEIFGLVTSLSEALEKERLDVKIDVAEAGKISYLYAIEDKPKRGEQVGEFFGSSSPYYIGNLPRVGKTISGHSYFTTSPFSEAVQKRRQLVNEIASVDGLEFWMSEYCILGDNAGEIEGNGRDLGIDPALYLARVIHNDLAVANASAWHWWLGISPYDYKDGLVYVDKEKSNGNYYESKLLWALGNFSRFIRPGAVRIAANSPEVAETESSILVSSYIHPQDKQITTVIINTGLEPVAAQLAFGQLQVKDLRYYRTSKDESLKAGQDIQGSSVVVPARSITTVVGSVR